MFTLKFKKIFSYLIIKIFNWINLQSNIKKPGNKETNTVSFEENIIWLRPTDTI